jgi:hypothetical protein
MADLNVSLNNQRTISSVTVEQPKRATIVSTNFRAKPNVALSEINGVTVDGVQNGYTLVYNSTTNVFEPSEIIATGVELARITGGDF